MTAPVVLVTGASRGIGKATAFALAHAGASLALHARNEERLTEVVKALRERGARVDYIVGDIRDPDTGYRLVANAKHTFKRVDALVNNAGVIEPIAPVKGVDVEAFARNIQINLLGAVYAARAALPELEATNGRVINVSSGAGTKTVRGWSAYCTAKAGLNHFTRVCAAELPNVTCVAFSPGMTATDMQAVVRENGKSGMPAEDLARFTDAYERDELRDPEDAGRVIAALALAAPENMNGAFITIDDPRVEAIMESLEPSTDAARSGVAST